MRLMGNLLCLPFSVGVLRIHGCSVNDGNIIGRNYQYYGRRSFDW